MDEFLKGGSSAVAIILFLLPGFVGMAVYEYLVEGIKREVFDKIVYALSITLVSALCAHAIFQTATFPVVVVKEGSNVFDLLGGLVGTGMASTTLCSVVLSVVFAGLNNHGVILSLARWARVTYKISPVDVWQDVFDKFRGDWIRVTFSDGRELIGWPRYFSAVGQPREILVADATWWLTAGDGTITSEDVKGHGVYIADFSAVRTITWLDGDQPQA